MDTPVGVMYTGVLMAVALGMTAWRLAGGPVKVGPSVDKVLAGCMITSVVLFVAFLAPHYIPGIRVP